MTIERKLVIDTNLRVSSLLPPAGVASVARLAVDSATSLGNVLMSEETLAELCEVLSRSKFDRFVSKEYRHRFLLEIKKNMRLVPVMQRIAVCRDPKDDKFIDVALNGGAQPILTGDKDLLAPHPFRGVAILSPRAFLAECSASASPGVGPP